MFFGFLLFFCVCVCVVLQVRFCIINNNNSTACENIKQLPFFSIVERYCPNTICLGAESER